MFWLVTGHTWNPMLWLGESRLVSVVERIFLESGAQRCDPGEFFDQSTDGHPKS